MEDDDSSSVVVSTCDLKNATESISSQVGLNGRSIAIFCLLMSLSFITALLNTMILISFHIEKKLRTYSNQYILNITISDLLTGFIMAIRSVVYIQDKWFFGQTLLHVFVGVQNTIITVSTLGIIAIGFDRYVATHYPLLHYRRKKKMLAHFVNSITWVVAACFWFPIATLWDLVEPLDVIPEGDIFTSRYLMNTRASLAVTISRFVVPFAIIVLISVKIYLRVKISGSKNLSLQLRTRESKTGAKVNLGNTSKPGKKQDSSTGDPSANTSQDTRIFVQDDRATQESAPKSSTYPEVESFSSTKKCTRLSQLQILQTSQTTIFEGIHRHPFSADNHKALRTMTLIILAFFMTSLPGCISIMKIDRDGTLSFVGRWATFMNSPLNPVTYAMAQPLFRKTLLKVIGCNRSRHCLMY